jgi:predicted branched-subunit amino acid permease
MWWVRGGLPGSVVDTGPAARNGLYRCPEVRHRPTRMTARSAFVAGARAIGPLLPAGATVGLVTGLAATTVGLSTLQTAAMAVAVYSPSVMLTAFGLLETGAPVGIVVATSLVVGARFMLLSLSISTYLRHLSSAWRWLLAYFLWTPVYALAVERYESDRAVDRRMFYLGCAAPMWGTFQTSLLVGAVSGGEVPEALQLEFVVPLAFIALLVRLVDDRPSTLAAAVAGGLAVGGAGLPLNTGIVVATVGGTVAGVLFGGREDT